MSVSGTSGQSSAGYGAMVVQLAARIFGAVVDLAAMAVVMAVMAVSRESAGQYQDEDS
ncbi:MAG: hypothetical protein ACLUI7_03850 [Coprococcus sp.]